MLNQKNLCPPSQFPLKFYSTPYSAPCPSVWFSLCTSGSTSDKKFMVWLTMSRVSVSVCVRIVFFCVVARVWRTWPFENSRTRSIHSILSAGWVLLLSSLFCALPSRFPSKRLCWRAQKAMWCNAVFLGTGEGCVLASDVTDLASWVGGGKKSGESRWMRAHKFGDLQFTLRRGVAF